MNGRYAAIVVAFMGELKQEEEKRGGLFAVYPTNPERTVGSEGKPALFVVNSRLLMRKNRRG